MIGDLQLKEFQEILEDRRKEILSQLEQFAEALLLLQESRPPEFSEEAQEEATAINLKALDVRERRELADIGAALEKISRRTFGVCERCSAEIGLMRLQALPWVRLCISCQKHLEERIPDSQR